MSDGLDVYAPSSGGTSVGGDNIGISTGIGTSVIPVVAPGDASISTSIPTSSPANDINLIGALSATEMAVEVDPRKPGQALVAYLNRRISSLENRFGNLEALP